MFEIILVVGIVLCAYLLVSKPLGEGRKPYEEILGTGKPLRTLRVVGRGTCVVDPREATTTPGVIIKGYKIRKCVQGYDPRTDNSEPPLIYHEDLRRMYIKGKLSWSELNSQQLGRIQSQGYTQRTWYEKCCRDLGEDPGL